MKNVNYVWLITDDTQRTDIRAGNIFPNAEIVNASDDINKIDGAAVLIPARTALPVDAMLEYAGMASTISVIDGAERTTYICRRTASINPAKSR